MSDTSTAHKVGDIVIVNDDRVLGLKWIVRRVNEKTYSLDQVDADGHPFPECRRTRAAKELVHKPPKPGDPVGQPYQPITLYSPGEFVRYNGRKTIAGLSTGDIAVVTRDEGRARIHIAKPGGHQDQEITMDRRGVEAVDTAIALGDLASKMAGVTPDTLKTWGEKLDTPAPAPEPEPRPALVQVPVPGQPATVGILKGWLQDVPDSMPVILSRDDMGDTHAALGSHTEAVAKKIPGGMGFMDAWWDQPDTAARDLFDYMPPADAQRVFVLVPQV